MAKKAVIASYYCSVVGINADGTASGAGYSSSNHLVGIDGWADLVHVSDNYSSFLGVKSDGTCVVSGTMNSNYSVAIAALTDVVTADLHYSDTATFVKSDGTCVTVGDDSYNVAADAATWTDIIQVAGGHRFALGLKSDGTVVKGGTYTDNVTSDMVSGWTDIVAIDVNQVIAAAVKSDGTCVTANTTVDIDVSAWTDIVDIKCGPNFVIGLKSDGTVVHSGYDFYGVSGVESWTNIVAIAASLYDGFGIQADGAAIAVGRDNYNEVFNVNLWTDMMLPGQDEDDEEEEEESGADEVVIAIEPSAYSSFNVVLTGTSDSTTDVELPCSNLHARLRSGSQSYLSATIPYTSELADAISARPNGDLYLYYNYGGTQTEVVNVALGVPQISRGTESSSIVVTGHRQSTNDSPGSHTVTAKSTQSGSTSTITVPGYNPEILPGDDVTAHGITITANLVSVQASVSDSGINIQTTYSEGS